MNSKSHVISLFLLLSWVQQPSSSLPVERNRPDADMPHVVAGISSPTPPILDHVVSIFSMAERNESKESSTQPAHVEVPSKLQDDSREPAPPASAVTFLQQGLAAAGGGSSTGLIVGITGAVLVLAVAAGTVCILGVGRWKRASYQRWLRSNTGNTTDLKTSSRTLMCGPSRTNLKDYRSDTFDLTLANI